MRWPRVDDFVFWGMNLGLVGFFVSLLAESTALEQIATPLMGVAITVGLVEHTLRLGTPRDGGRHDRRCRRPG